MHLAHGALDVEGLNVLPSLLQQRNEEVHGHLDVEGELVGGETDVTDGDTDAKNLLQLELDSALHVVELVSHGLVVSEEDRELASLVKVRSEKFGNLTDDSLGSQEVVVLLGELLDGLLLLILLHVTVLLEVFHGQAGDAELLSLVSVELIS